MIRIFIAVTLLLLSISTLSAQDVLVDRKGNELPCKLISADKKYFVYKGYQDPEFTSQKTPISRYRKIRYADGREIKISPPATGWIFFGTGPVLPLSSYSSTNINNQYAGFAKTGTGFQLEVAIPAFGKHKQWSIVTMLGGFSNDINNNGKASWYQSQGNQSNVGGYHNNDKKDNRWNSGQALLGLGYTLPLSWKFSFDQKLALGVSSIKKNTEHYMYYSNVSGTSVYYQYYAYGSVKGDDTLRAQSLAMTFSYGAAMRFNISRRIALRLGADFQYAAPTFKVHQYLTPDPPSGQAFDPDRTETVHNKVVVLKLTFGICFNLIPKNIDYGIPE